MQKAARGFMIATIVLAMALPLLYVGSEGIWYAASGTSYFEPGTTYRTVYAPLDLAGDRWPRIYDGRQFLANGWLRLRGNSSGEAHVRPTPPWVVMLQLFARDVQYIQAAEEVELTVEAAANEQQTDGASSDGATVEPDDEDSRTIDATDSRLD